MVSTWFESTASLGVAIAALTVAGCQAAPAQRVAAAAMPQSAPAAGVVRSLDGVPIHYEDQGNGPLTLVFVHGWSCDRGYWSAQRDYFAETHRVVAIDLAGHGDSGLAREEWTMAAFANDVAAVVSTLGLESVVLVGHSMGGKVVVEAAAQLKDRVVAIVGADTFHNGGRKTPAARGRQVLAELEADYPRAMVRLTDRMFIPESDATLRGFIQKDMASAPAAAAIGSRRASGGYDATAAIARLSVPLILISSDFLPTDLDHLRANAKQFEYREMSDVGHFVMLEDPDTFNAHLEAVVARFQ